MRDRSHRDAGAEGTGRHGAETMRHVVLVLVALVAVSFAVIWALQRRLIYLPSPSQVPSAREVIAGARDIQLTTSDGLELGAWYVPGRGSRSDIAVLVANGNAGDRSLRAPLARALAREGLSVLLFDYRGYGDNPGHPSEEGLARDARAAYRFLIEEKGIPSERLLYYGESLGAAVVTELATEHPPGGLVVRSPFTDLASVGRVHYPFLPVDAMLVDHYPLIEHIRRVNVPTIVVYGTQDSIVPPVQTRAVARAASGPTQVIAVEGADHNDLVLLNGRELIDAIVVLADRIATRAASEEQG